MTQTVARYQIRVAPASAGSCKVFLVEDGGRIVASANLAKTTTAVVLTAHTEDPNLDAWTGNGIFDMDTVEDSPLPVYRAFRQMSIRESLIDSAYSWLMAHILPDYDQPDLEYENDTFVLSADGKRLGGSAAARSGGSAKGGARPKSKKVRIDTIWF